LAKAENYSNLRPVYLLSINNHILFSKNKDPVSYHCITDTSNGECSIPYLKFAFIELPKFNKEESDLETPLDYWIYMLKNATTWEKIPEQFPEPVKEAIRSLEKHKWSHEEF